MGSARRGSPGSAAGLARRRRPGEHCRVFPLIVFWLIGQSLVHRWADVEHAGQPGDAQDAQDRALGTHHAQPAAAPLDALVRSADFTAALTTLDARHKLIRPHCPWQNGKAERFNRTLTTEWAYRQVFTSNTQRAQHLAPWLEHYNTQRRHTALGGRPPITRLTPTS